MLMGFVVLFDKEAIEIADTNVDVMDAGKFD